MSTPIPRPKIANAARMARNLSFRDRALVVALREALAVIREPESTTNHIHRVGYARSLLQGPEQYQSTVAWVLASAPPLADYVEPDDIPEEVLSGTLRDMWNALSMPQ